MQKPCMAEILSLIYMGDIVFMVRSGTGTIILASVAFLEAVGLPVPAAIALLVAGATLPFISLPIALVTILSADTLMFFVGRYTGWWLLSMLCRLSLNPEACILGAADAFYKRGRWVLAFAKFVPGPTDYMATASEMASMK